MATRIKLKRSTVAATVPTTSNLEDGEVALNIADKKLYARNGSNIIEVANQKPNTGEVVTTMLSTDITNGQGNTFYVASVGSDNTTLANGGAGGKHPDTPFLTITKALTTATSGDTIIVAPGEYQETFPMTIPDGVTLRGTNLRSTSVKPTSVTNANTAFILSGDAHISDMTIKDFYYDSSNDDGYAFEVVSNMNSTTSPYIERVTVTTKGSVVSGSDPYGYNQGDAGRGAKLDGANIASGSQHGSVLFNECTFITPNQVGLYVTNGMRVEWLNCFNYFASIGIQGIQGATGKSGSGSTRLKLGGTSGTFSTSEVTYQLENSFQSGTYARSGTTITLTRTAHGLVSNDYIYADHISGAGTDNFYQVTKVDNNTVTYTDSSASGTTSGNVTYKKAVARGVVASNDGTYIFITGKGTGAFTVVNKSAKTLSRFGDSQLDTAQKKFGTASILLDGTEDNVKVPTDEDFGFGSANWCLEAFIRPGSVTGTQRIFDLRDGSATDTAPTMYLNGTALHFAVGNTSQINGGTLATGTWYHVAVARSGGTTKLFLDGTELGTYTDSNDYGSTTPVVIGSDYQASPTEAFNGHVDEVRISKGAARFTAGFTPTTSEYSSDNNTVLLLHANGTDASTTFTDASGGTSDIRSSGGDSATSVITADYSAFGAEIRSVGSACVYGQKGAQADGSGVKLILTSHNFGYVGAGADYTNDPSLAVQNNEVEELNNGQVLFSSTDHLGDFRVGDALTVDVSTGSVNFQASSTAQSAANITLSDATGTTNIFPAYIETGNLRFSGNSMTSTTGQVIVDPSGNEDFVVNAETIVKEAVFFDTAKSIAFGSSVQGALRIRGFSDSLLFGSSEAANYSSRAFVVFKNGLGTVNLDSAGTGYVGGSQTVTVTSNPFQAATATATIATTGAIKKFTVTNRGNMSYTEVPDVTVSGTGSGAGTAQMGSGQRVISVTVDAGGSGFVSPTIAFDAPPQQTFTGGVAAITVATDSVIIANHPFETGQQISLDTTTLDTAAVAPTGLAAGTYYAIRVDKDTFQVASSQSNANNGTQVPITGTGSGNMFFIGVTATGNVTITGDAITGVTVTNEGTGYTGAPLTTVTDSAGTGENLSVVMGKNVDALIVSNAGTYANNATPTVTIAAATGDTTGSGATATATLGFAVESINLDTQGLGYRSNPIVTLSPAPAIGENLVEAVVTSVLDEKEGRIASISLDTSGSGYETAPTLAFSGGAGSGGTLQIDIQSLSGTITASGSGYTAGTYQNVSFTTTGNGTGATATFVIPGFQGTITAAGTGYTDTGETPVSIEFRNPPTTTFTVTVVQRARLSLSSITGTFAVGNTVTGSVSNANGTVSFVGADYLYLSGVTGTFQDAQTDTISNGSGASGTLELVAASVDRYVIDGNEAGSFTLIDDNTYKFDTSDSTNTNHPLAFGAAQGMQSRQYRTPGTAGSYFEVVVGSVSSTTTTSTYQCTVHGAGMGEGGVITYTTGTAGQSGLGMSANVTISGGSVTAVVITSQGTGGNYAIGHQLIADQDDIGGTGSGFIYTLASNTTGVTSVTGISLTGEGYTIGEVLGVADGDVGAGGGSGFQFTINNVGFATAASVGNAGGAYELADTLVLGEVGPPGSTQGSGLVVSLTGIASEKSLELDQEGKLTLGASSATGQVIVNKDGTLTTPNWNVSSTGAITAVSAAFSAGVAITTSATVGTTLAVSGTFTASAGVTISGGTSAISNTSLKLLDGTEAAPSLTFDNSDSTGFYRAAADDIGITVGGTRKGKVDTNGLYFTGLKLDSDLTNANPFFNVDTSTSKLELGPTAAKLTIDNTNTIGTDGTDINVPLNFDTKGEGDFTFIGGTNVDFKITDGTSDVVSIDSGTGTATFSGNLDAGKLRIRQNVVSNNSGTSTRSFGQVVSLTVTGTGSGYTDGTYTATATTGGSGTGLTVTVTVASGTFSSVAVVAKGQNYKVGDSITITAAGSGTGLTVAVADIDGSGVVLKPGGGFDVLCDSTGSLVIPSGTTNQRPNTLDRITGAIRFNTSQLQFEGFNGNDFVSLGGVRDVDQDTYVLTESSPGADEDTFEFFNTGVNSLSISQTKFTLRSAKTFDVAGTLRIDGITSGSDPLQVQRGGNDIAKFRDKKDFEICDGATPGLRLRSVPIQGTVATIGTVTSVGNNYGISQTYTGVASTGQFEGTGATFNVVTNGSGGITSVAINSGGSGYEVAEIITIGGNLLGGTAVTHDITFPVATLSSTVAPIARLDVIAQDYVTRTDGKSFISLDANGSESKWKINRGWASATESYLTVFDSTATFMELDDCRVEGGELTSFPSTASIVAFDKTSFKGSKTLVTIESDDNKVHMLEVTIVCASNGTTAHATVTNSITSDNDLMDATVSVVGSNVTISLAKSSAATSSSNFTGRFTTTKVKV